MVGMIYKFVTKVIQYFCFPIDVWKVGTSWFLEREGILEKGAYDPPPLPPLPYQLWYLFLKNWSIPQHISVCSVTIKFSNCNRRNQNIVLLNLDRSLDISQQRQFSILSFLKIVLNQKNSGPKKYASKLFPRKEYLI